MPNFPISLDFSEPPAMIFYSTHAYVPIRLNRNEKNISIVQYSQKQLNIDYLKTEFLITNQLCHSKCIQLHNSIVKVNEGTL